MKLHFYIFLKPGPIWVDPHQRVGGRGDVGGGDGVDRCQGRKGRGRGEKIKPKLGKKQTNNGGGHTCFDSVPTVLSLFLLSADNLFH